MAIAITGAAGFIGSHLAESLLGDGHEVLGIDSFSDYYSRSAKEHNLATALKHDRYRFIELDLAVDDLRDVFKDVEVVYHLAGRPGVRAAMTQFDQYVSDNLIATHRVLEAVKGVPLKSFVYAGSSSVYGDAETFPTVETALPAPLSPYGMTKLGGEHMAYIYWRNFGVPAVCVRYFSVYGPRMRPDLMLHRAMRAIVEGTVFEIYGDGEQTRELTYVSDAVAGTILAAQRGINCKVYNLGGGTSVTVNNVLTLLEEISGLELKRRHVAVQPGDHRRAGASIARARTELGWEPHVTLRQGLEMQWRWFTETQVSAGGHTGLRPTP